MLATLRSITEDIEEATGFSSQANADADGYWLRIAKAMEHAAGVTTIANNNRQGYMLRAG